MTEFYEAPGLPADWLNGWLAAVGVVVLLPETRLSWSSDVIPIARFHGPEIERLPERLVAAMPRVEQLAALAIRADGPGGKMGQSPTLATYVARAAEARTNRDWTLGIAHTDLGRRDSREVELAGKGPFNAGMEGDQTLWKRVMAIAHYRDESGLMQATLQGKAPRVGQDGLAFDCRRFSSGVQPSKRVCQPLVEYLAFFGISLFPVRGVGKRPQQRGWSHDPESFLYPVWEPELNSDAIDALLDLKDRTAHLAAATRWYRTRTYQRSGAEKFTGYYAERLR